MAVGGTSVLSQVLVMLQTLLLARWIGPELNAYVLAAFNVAGLGMILINWGFDHCLLQRTAMDVENSHKNLGLLLSFKLFRANALKLIENYLPILVYKAIYISKCISGLQQQALQYNFEWDGWVYHPPY